MYVSILCVQGNPPLDIPTRESREKNWSKKKPLEFYIFADNVNDRTRSDAAIFYVSHRSFSVILLSYTPAAEPVI